MRPAGCGPRADARAEASSRLDVDHDSVVDRESTDALVRKRCRRLHLRERRPLNLDGACAPIEENVTSVYAEKAAINFRDDEPVYLERVCPALARPEKADERVSLRAGVEDPNVRQTLLVHRADGARELVVSRLSEVIRVDPRSCRAVDQVALRHPHGSIRAAAELRYVHRGMAIRANAHRHAKPVGGVRGIAAVRGGLGGGAVGGELVPSG